MTPRKKIDTCCGTISQIDGPPDHSSELKRLNRIRGQIDGIGRMIEGRKYCPDILNQTAAVKAAIVSLESSILEKHLHACVKTAFATKGTKAEEAICELLEIFRRASK